MILVYCEALYVISEAVIVVVGLQIGNLSSSFFKSKLLFAPDIAGTTSTSSTFCALKDCVLSLKMIYKNAPKTLVK